MAIVIVSAAGHVLPPFLVYAGVNQMTKWFGPWSGEVFEDECGAAHWLSQDTWFPGNACEVRSANGSMEESLLPLLVEHIKTKIRLIVPHEKKVSLVWTHIPHGTVGTG